jgi:hypothetical protein
VSGFNKAGNCHLTGTVSGLKKRQETANFTRMVSGFKKRRKTANLTGTVSGFQKKPGNCKLHVNGFLF